MWTRRILIVLSAVLPAVFENPYPFLGLFFVAAVAGAVLSALATLEHDSEPKDVVSGAFLAVIGELLVALGLFVAAARLSGQSANTAVVVGLVMMAPLFVFTLAGCYAGLTAVGGEEGSLAKRSALFGLALAIGLLGFLKMVGMSALPVVGVLLAGLLLYRWAAWASPGRRWMDNSLITGLLCGGLTVYGIVMSNTLWQEAVGRPDK